MKPKRRRPIYRQWLMAEAFTACSGGGERKFGLERESAERKRESG
jgi:hypothetical protein